jgi:regulatory protein
MEEAQRAYVFALRALGRRDHSEAELRRKMIYRGISAGVVDDIIDKLKQSGYLDDRKFALRWAESAVRNGKGYGFRLRYELSRRGIAEDVASEVAERMMAEYDEGEAVKDLVARKFADFAAQSADDRQKRRIMGYLQRRGFSLTAILQVFRDME